MMPAIGYALASPEQPFEADPHVDGVEISVRPGGDASQLSRFIHGLDSEHLSVHARSFSVANPEPPARPVLESLRALCFETGAMAISDHLGLRRQAIAPAAPPRSSADALDICSRNVERLVDYFIPLGFFVENVAHCQPLDGAMSEAELLCKLLQRTGCGWLLDLENLCASARQTGCNPSEYLECVMPHAESVQIHLTGAPSFPWSLYRHALRLGQGKVAAVFVERDERAVSGPPWPERIWLARQIAEEAHLERLSRKCQDGGTSNAEAMKRRCDSH